MFTQINKMFPDNFIDKIITKDLSSGKITKVVTRFPPEPNGYLHLGHVKSILLNYSLAKKYGGSFHLRFDDTNPQTAYAQYYDIIINDLEWLELSPDRIIYASDHFLHLLNYATELIRLGRAYICQLTPEEHKLFKGSRTVAGRESPYRNRTLEENLELWDRICSGKIQDSNYVLRAKIDMQAGNLNLRDPILYRFKTGKHPRTEYDWLMYPSYDFAQPLSDALEGVTHSICTLEFEEHRPLYDWILASLNMNNVPQQIEFARLNVDEMITHKREIVKLIQQEHASGWDDPCLGTIRGLRNRGYTADMLKNFCFMTGVSKQNASIPKELLDSAVRTTLEPTAIRRFMVLKPLLVILDDQPVSSIVMPNNPYNSELGARSVSCSRHIFIEQSDFTLNLQPGQKKLTLGGEVRLLGLGDISCYHYKTNDAGVVIELHARLNPINYSYNKAKKPVAVLHWVDANNYCEVELICYHGYETTKLTALGEMELKQSSHQARYQAYRLGYIYVYDDLKARMIVYLKNYVRGERS